MSVNENVVLIVGADIGYQKYKELAKKAEEKGFEKEIEFYDKDLHQSDNGSIGFVADVISGKYAYAGKLIDRWRAYELPSKPFTKKTIEDIEAKQDLEDIKIKVKELTGLEVEPEVILINHIS